MLLICLQIRAQESIFGLLKRLQIRAQIFPIHAFHVSYFMLQAGREIRQISNKSKMMLRILYMNQGKGTVCQNDWDTYGFP
jgi:hypothetical protein